MKLRPALLVALVASALLLSACGKKGEEGKGGKSDQSENSEQKAGDRYQVRGIIVELPTGERNEIAIHHEEIPNFKTSDGVERGMASMQMPFGIDTALDGLAAGDKVKFDLEARWDSKPPLVVISIEKLPADTELKLEGHSGHAGH